LRAQGYWEYVQSKSNWADYISRLGFDDPWWRCHGFSFHLSYLPTIFFHLPFIAVILTFEFSSSALGVVVRWVIAKAGSSLG
jgi:hypothetical protein